MSSYCSLQHAGRICWFTDCRSNWLTMTLQLSSVVIIPFVFIACSKYILDSPCYRGRTNCCFDFFIYESVMQIQSILASFLVKAPFTRSTEYAKYPLKIIRRWVLWLITHTHFHVDCGYFVEGLAPWVFLCRCIIKCLSKPWWMKTHFWTTQV